MDYKTYLHPDAAGAKAFKKYITEQYGYKRPALKGPLLVKGPVVTDVATPSQGLINASKRGASYLRGRISQIDEALTAASLTPDDADFVRHVRLSLDELYLCAHSDGDAGFGCSCGIYGSKPHEGGHVNVMTTVDHAIGAAEGIIHELGHHRLHALDIQLLSSPDTLIGNDDADVYDSPVRFDIQRPMAACLHAEYSYAVVTHFYTNLIGYMLDMDLHRICDASLQDIASRQAYNIKRIGNGVHLMRQHFKAGTDAAFHQALTDYVETQYTRARDQIQQVAPDSDWQPVAGDI